ncbi:unnamed protein product [Allacma fusca]|uniref:DUF6589 domain-containing protein n=1 Tax=Allacma fusca TaxID=39272 RepID=A0A8J2NSM7_9HEXA|nr:unnamed protein product [Allacma fusca]
MFLCSRCDVPTSKKLSFSAKCPNTEVTVFEACNILLDHNPVTPLKLKQEEQRLICLKCAGKLGRLYNTYYSFVYGCAPNSYVSQKFKGRNKHLETPPCSPDENGRSVETLTPPKKPPRTRIRTPMAKRIRKEVKTTKGSVVIRNCVSQICRDEITKFIRSSCLKSSVTSLNDIPCPEVVETELKKFAPTVLCAIRGICGVNNAGKLPLGGFAAVCILANQRNQRCNKLQKFMSFLLLKAKAPKEVFDVFNKYKITVSRRTAEICMDDLRQNYNSKIISYKEETEHVMNGVTNSPRQLGARKKLKFDGNHELKTLSFVFDNLNKSYNPRDLCSNIFSKQINVVCLLGIFNRISCDFSTWNFGTYEVLPTEIPDSVFLPTKNDEIVLRNEHKVLLRRCLADHLLAFAKLRKKTELCRISNEYTTESSAKSDTVNLGVLLHDENKTDGMINILEDIAKYCPVLPDKQRMPTVVWGDGLTVHRIESAKRHRGTSYHVEDQLQTLVAGIGNWHRRCLVFRDDMNTLLKDTSLTCSPGTLPYLRSRLKYNQASLDIKSKFNETYTFFNLVWQSYVLAMACEKLNIIRLDEIPESLVGLTHNDLCIALDSLVNEIISFSWHSIQPACTQDKYCICSASFDSEDDQASWIACDYRECHHKQWYHTTCVTADGIVGSDDESQIHSEDEEDADTQKSIKQAFRKKKKWYCSSQCRQATRDKKVMYSKAVIFCGLMHEGLRDAVRENDANRLIVHTKYNLIQYVNKRHTTYSKITTNMLYNMNFHPSPTVRQDLKWNSCVNVVGERGKNLEMDLYNEFVIKSVKDFCGGGRGLTENSMVKRSQAIGILCQIGRNIKLELSAEEHQVAGRNKNWKADVQACVDILVPLKLTQFGGHRSHYGFETFNINYMYVGDRSVLLTKIREHLRQLQEVIQCGQESAEEAVV